MSEKKKSLLLTNVHDFYVLEDKTSQKNFRPSVCLYVCLSACLSVWMYVRTWTFHVDTIIFEPCLKFSIVNFTNVLMEIAKFYYRGESANLGRSMPWANRLFQKV